MIRILIGGDICPMGRIQDAFIQGNADDIFHDLLEEINDADLSIVNLECPLISRETPIDKPGGVLEMYPRVGCSQMGCFEPGEQSQLRPRCSRVA